MPAGHPAASREAPYMVVIDLSTAGSRKNAVLRDNVRYPGSQGIHNVRATLV